MAALTVYNDVILPHSVIAAAGLQGRNQRNNTRRQSQAGYQNINVNWARTLRQYDLGFIPMLPAVWRSIEGIHEVTEGGAYGFLLTDPKDSTAAATEGLMYPTSSTTLLGAIGLGYGVPTYRLYKRIAAVGTTRTKDRAITRPLLAGNVLKRDAATVVLGAGAGQAALNVDTGTVTFVADSSSTVTAVTVGATTVVTLTAALSGLAIGGRLYLAGLTGAGAAALNGLSHAISNIASNVYTLTTVTTGLTITPAGSGYKYPQPTEALTWSGSFYVPVHFASDDLDWSLVAGGPAESRLIMGSGVVLQEVRE